LKKKAPKGYFISIGGGKNQVPLIQTIQTMGSKPITVDKSDTAPGFEISKIKILESTQEYRKILNALSTVPMTEPLVGIGSRSYGPATYTTAYLAQKLRLPGADPESVRLFLDKNKYLGILDYYKIRVPKSFSSKSKQSFLRSLAPENFPLIGKPATGSGKQGIQKFYDKDQLKKFLDEHPESLDRYRFEEFISGDEITVMGFVKESRLQILEIFDKWTLNDPPFIEYAHTYPSRYLRSKGEIHVILQNLVYRTGLATCPLFAEFKITEEGDLVLIEAGPEVGGEFLAEYFLEKAKKYPYFQNLYLLLIGEETERTKPFPENQKKFGIFFSLPKNKKSGIAKTIEGGGEDLLSFPLEPGEILSFDYPLPGSSENANPSNLSRLRVIGLEWSPKSPDLDMESWVKSVKQRLEDI
jgi:hypothetical protein